MKPRPKLSAEANHLAAVFRQQIRETTAKVLSDDPRRAAALLLDELSRDNQDWFEAAKYLIDLMDDVELNVRFPKAVNDALARVRHLVHSTPIED